MEQYEAVTGVARPTLEDLSLAGYNQSQSSILEENLLQYIAATAQGIKMNLDYIKKNGGSSK